MHFLPWKSNHILFMIVHSHVAAYRCNIDVIWMFYLYHLIFCCCCSRGGATLYFQFHSFRQLTVIIYVNSPMTHLNVIFVVVWQKNYKARRHCTRNIVRARNNLIRKIFNFFSKRTPNFHYHFAYLLNSIIISKINAIHNSLNITMKLL